MAAMSVLTLSELTVSGPDKKNNVQRHDVQLTRRCQTDEDASIATQTYGVGTPRTIRPAVALRASTHVQETRRYR